MTANNSASRRTSPCPTSGSPKVQSWHLDRLAIVYVRQSTAQQVAENRESGDRQYALAQRAVHLGWPADRVLVIDDDQGKSGATAEGRLGFQRLLAEVGLDHVGLILGLEMSRLARSCKDSDHNDRLLLGLTGIMSEAELHVLRSRMRQGLLNKVRRGEVFLWPPVGYVRSPSGGFDFEPDEQARAAVVMVFDQFDRLGTVRKVLRYLVTNGIRLGIRPHCGPNRGHLEWREPTRDTVMAILRRPVYAGYYSYGERQTDPRRRQPGHRWSGRVVVPVEDYLALIPDKVPAYISRERYEANLGKLAENRARIESKGAVREGPSLLAGLVVCGRCGRCIIRGEGRCFATRAGRVRGTCVGRALRAWPGGWLINSWWPRCWLRWSPERWN
jgi:DNA invertase Pin-like site-specific DNA recombinase